MTKKKQIAFASLRWNQRARINIIFDKYFKSFLEIEKSIGGNRLYLFPSKARRIFLKELLGEELSKRDLDWKKEYKIK